VRPAQRSVLHLVAAMLLAAPSSWASDAVFPPLDRAPLAPPLRLTGDFGEHRSTHFHAGIDLSTDERVGAPVLAPLAGRIVRVRASGVGYGRSIYLESRDGRLLVFGHLDGFDEPLASYVAGVQDSTGQYEQDLWPDSTLFPVDAGQRIGWSGRSGTGPPHLHFEIRRGDMAINPVLAGAEVEDTVAPVIRSVTLEPLDERSSVAGGSAPYTVTFPSDSSGATAEPRITATGRLRVTVEALDARANGRYSMAPWSASMEWAGERVECRFDSVSWADGMPEVDFVYDLGRATDHGSTSVLMWAPRGFRPRVLHASAPLERDAGTVVVPPGRGGETLRLTARDAAGHSTTRTLRVEPEAPPESVADTTFSAMFASARHEFPQRNSESGVDPETGDFAPALPSATMLGSTDLHFASLPDGWLRIEVVGGRWNKRRPLALSLAGQHALLESAGRYAAVFRPERLPHEEILRLVGGTPRWSARSRPMRITAATNGGGDSLPGFRWRIPEGALFEPATWVATTGLHRSRVPELAPVSPMFDLMPGDHPLRSAITLELAVPARHSLKGLGLYRDNGDGWEFIRARVDTLRRMAVGESRRLGRFSLFRDTRAPRVVKRPEPVRASAGAPPSWALEVRIEDEGSGIDARATAFEIDGRRVPSEWDAEEHTLRWRPHSTPAAGTHRYRLIASDRVGNVGRSGGSFVLD
jgi:hypothetical protein